MFFKFFKIALVSNLLVSSFAFSQNYGKKLITVSCNSSQLAGGINLQLSGKLEIVTDPLTQALKVKDNSFLTVKEGNSIKQIKVSGMFIEILGHLQANEESSNSYDDRTYSSIDIYLKDSSQNAKSSIFKIKGSSPIPLNCGKY